MSLFGSKRIIYGCDSRGDGDSPYLTRWTLLATKPGKLYLHKFHRSDAPDSHCHPWDFWSFVLWPGYWEETPAGRTKRRPLSLAFRPAEWRHRVQLLLGTCPTCGGNGLNPFGWTDECGRCFGFGTAEHSCWTLIWVGPKVRDWGFFTAHGWQNWRDYFREKGC